jgi:hypothetical protein
MPFFRRPHLYLRNFVGVLAGISAVTGVALGIRDATTTRRTPPIAAPTIQRSPLSVSSAAGRNVVFTVEAISTAPLTYGWEFNGATIVGATQPWLLLPNVTTAQTGTYTIRVSNAHGTTTRAATLTVLTPSVETPTQTKRRNRGSSGSLAVRVHGQAR